MATTGIDICSPYGMAMLDIGLPPSRSGGKRDQIDAPPCARLTSTVSQAHRTRNRPRKSRALRSAAQKEPRRGEAQIGR